ncbi:unnamed protein product [Aureobasidium pullulans]|uniref:Uncharacterized protein n=2 Tax=Aureobasidium pullulans TaxID=5580 RepID=A0A074X2H6_AURPU|nr:uncharacterized protein M438DRAFT_409394 [Aureobasidium pullulans EXF-150]OBW65273.1 MAG: Uncharacterized protein AUREO_046600 [Aureobasidium pullulans]KEQ79675.1 hypothetical protein M438DRAFT_409394 [Aureobasidium pullulans EXF-150]THV98345.1 hypothetical protein D6D27_01583 [Aureobasidium pullulans]THW44120.1 hypothetical protein D6D21_05045 [Aureobasidium pullulans]THW69620.1 hypothetical protein D6D25_00900 [Aureobasidium pullulans]
MSGIVSTIEGLANTVTTKAMAIVDSVFPPERRQELLTKLQQFAIKNPKLSAFLLTNIALTGPPMFLFILFTLTVFIFSLVVALLVGLLVAIGFTLFMVIVALVILFPTVFFTTLAACFFFLWGLGGYYLLKWFNKGESPAAQGDAIGDKINALTGGRLDFIMGGARQEYPDHSGQNGKDEGSPKQNGKPRKLQDNPAKSTGVDMGKQADSIKKNANVGNVTNKATKQANLDGVTKQAGADGVTKKTDGVTGTAKGLAGGAAGGLV